MSSTFVMINVILRDDYGLSLYLNGERSKFQLECFSKCSRKLSKNNQNIHCLEMFYFSWT